MIERIEPLRSYIKKGAAAGALGFLGVLTACGGDTPNRWVVGVACPEGTKLDVTEVSPINSDGFNSSKPNAHIAIACDESNGQAHAPTHIRLLEGKGSKVASDQLLTDRLSIGFSDNDGTTALSYDVETNQAVISFTNIMAIGDITDQKVSPVEVPAGSRETNATN